MRIKTTKSIRLRFKAKLRIMRQSLQTFDSELATYLECHPPGYLQHIRLLSLKWLRLH